MAFESLVQYACGSKCRDTWCPHPIEPAPGVKVIIAGDPEVVGVIPRCGGDDWQEVATPVVLWDPVSNKTCRARQVQSWYGGYHSGYPYTTLVMEE